MVAGGCLGWVIWVKMSTAGISVMVGSSEGMSRLIHV